MTFTERSRILHTPEGSPLALRTNEYGELQVVQRHTLLDIKQVDQAPDPNLVTGYTASGGASTYSRDQSATLLTTTTAADSIAVLQSRQHPNYQAGKRNKSFLTAGAPAPAAGAYSEIGVFTDSDGLFWRRAGTGGDSFVLRSSVSGSVIDREFPRAAWADPLDGTGPSGATLSPGDSPIFFVYYSWFGVADPEFGFIIDGRPIICYTASNKAAAAPYMRTPCLPARWQIRNGASGAAGPSELAAGCASIESEGSQADITLGLPGCVDTDSDGLIAVGAGAYVSLLAVRLKDNVNQTVIPLAGSVSATSNDSGSMRMLFNPTLTGTPTWLDGGGAIQYSRTQMPVTADTGRKLSSVGYNTAGRSASAGLSTALALGRTYAGVSDIVVLAVKADGAQNIRGSLEYREVP